MKYLIYFLLILNTAFFAWQNLQPSKEIGVSQNKKPTELSSQVQRLLLLSEVDPQTMSPLVALKDAPVEKETTPVADKQTATDKKENIAKLPVEPEPDILTEIIEIDKLPARKMKQIVLENGKEIKKEVKTKIKPLIQDKGAVQEVIKKPDTDPEEKAPKKVPETIADKQIEEEKTTENQDVVSKVVALFNNLIPESTQKTCFSMQEIDKEEDINALKTWLMKQDAIIQDNNRVEQIARSYWVYLAPAASKEDALTTLVKLERSGAKDFARLRGGDMRNAISLGLFSQSASTRRRVVEMQKLGFKPKVKTRYKDIIHYGIKGKVTAQEKFDIRLITKQFPDLPAPIAENCEEISFSE